MTAWEEYVGGRTVAVVGPAPPVGDQSEEIDAHDIVVRFAWFGEPPVPGAGTRTDVAYFNSSTGKKIMAGERVVPASLDWACFKSPQMELRRPNWRHSLQTKPRLRNPNMVPMSANDLLAAGAAKVKVFCADFYASAVPYGDDPMAHLPGNVPAGSDLRTIMQSTLTAHDQMAQRRFMRLLLGEHQGRLTGDERFLLVLAMDDVQYRSRLRSLWPTEGTKRTWVHVRTGRVRHALIGSKIDRALDAHPNWEER